ncbi:hypothetical protein CRV03_06300 [Arcobacter sp. F155]|uniref:motility associated factor glycosyltransferase family protein n=1 Tax=Arcobacter sp. F155 TaxID=2044512 RepID=UPI00100AF0E4|nr:6-hydroxymethylpterin diphosphokinase MptE-like protein [Arcobacter sp. F155]RXJ77295.1 hypothetical protein CRV03_06300 [Arcobacter sp. F155]
MTETEIQLQTALTNTFLANLAFLSDYDKELYLRVDGLSQAINSGDYKERYFLEFIHEEGEFDIYDEKEEKYVYERRPTKLINKAKNLDFSSKGSFSNLKKSTCQGAIYNLDVSDEPVSLKDSMKMIINDTTEYVNVFNDKVDTYGTKKYKEFNKFVIIGTLLGRHILSIHKKIKPELYFICEQNLEIFRLSLFVFDYSQILRDGSGIIFSVMDDDNVFDNKVSSFLRYKAYTNYCVKFFTSDYNVSNLFDKVATALSSSNPFAYNYISSLYNLANNDSKIIGNYNRVNIKNVKNNLTDKPIIFVGAGPSLAEEIEWLQNNKDKFIVVAMAATLNKLIEYDIIPDIISTADSGETIVLKQFNLENNLELIKDKIILASSMTSHNILKNFKKENVFTFDVMTSFFTNTLFYSAYSVSEMTISWLLSLNCKNLYFLGVDLALNQDTGESHIQGYHSTKKLELENKEFFVEKGAFLNDDTLQVEGNFLETVHTTRLFLLSLKAMNNIINSLYTDDIQLFNISKHGAKISNTTPILSKDIKLEKIDKNMDEIKEKLNTNVIKELSKENIKKLEEEKLFLKEILTSLKNEKEKIHTHDDFTSFINNFYSRFNKNYLKLVASNRFLSIYLDTILLYVTYCLNDKKLKKEKNKIEKTMLILESQLKKMIEDYISYSERVRKQMQ